MQPARYRRPGSVHISAPSFPVGVRPTIYRRIAYTFIGLTVFVVLGVLWLTSVRAEVTVKLKQDAVRLDGVVEVAKEPRAGQIPGRIVQGVFPKTREFTVTGASGQPSDPTQEPAATEPPPSNDVLARGTVKIINTYSKAQPLVKTTRLLTPDGKLYRIDETINVPAGGEVTVKAYSDKPGRQYVLTQPMKFTIPGLYVDLQKFIYAETVGPFDAVPLGTTETASVDTSPSPSSASPNARPVSYEDLDRAKKSLTDEILNDAMKVLANQVENRDAMEVVYVVKVVDESKNAKVGQVTDSFLYSIKLEVTAVYYSKADMQALVRSRLRERVPEGREFLPFSGGAVTYALESADPQSEVSAIRVTADANYRLSPTNPLLQKSVIAGKSIDEAKNLLQSIDGVDSAEIVVRPSWLGSLPALKDRIELNIE